VKAGRHRHSEQYRDDGNPRRGRRRKELTQEQRLAIVAAVRKSKGIGLPTLQKRIPGLPRNAAAAYLHRVKRVMGRRRRRNWRIVKWLVAGAVWAIDGTWLDHPVEGRGRRALVVVELHSRKVLCLESVAGERASAVIACLRKLIARHGAPLVLKADNGSAFISKAVARLCRQHGITLLHSPVRQPRWNGTCEVSGRWAKARAMAAAALRGDPEHLTEADLACAITFQGEMARIEGAVREHFLGAVERELAGVMAERGLAERADLGDHLLRSLRRVAVRRALQLCHILSIEGREYHQRLPRYAA
jgi:transposase InsO family protein